MGVRTIILFVIPCVFLFGIPTNGLGCKTTRDCQLDQVCDKGSCRCTQGYVGHLEKCLPLKIHGEECVHEIQCNDHRMVCSNDENDMTLKRFCFCDMYHVWNSTVNQCLDITNFTQVAGTFREAYDVSGMLERSAERVFLGVVVAGLIFVSILLSFIGICSIYGCCQKRKKGRYGGSDIGKDKINEVAIIDMPPGTYEVIETDFSAMDIM